jgi:hypothetical protein
MLAVAPASASTVRKDSIPTLLLLELAIPDLSYELSSTPGRSDIVLSAPFLYEVPVSERWTVDVFAEPQYNAGAKRFRVAAGSRVTVGPLWREEDAALFVEGGAFAEEAGGLGYFGGVGLARYRLSSGPATLGSLSYRMTVIESEVRHTIALDLVRMGLNALLWE